MELDKVIGCGNGATVYRHGEYAIKLFEENYDKTFIFYEALVNSIIEKVDLPIPKVYEILNINGQLGIKMDYIHGSSLIDYILEDIENIEIYIEKMVKLQIEIHSKDASILTCSFKDKLRDKIRGNSNLSEVIKDGVFDVLEELPEGSELCHGDLHGYNILVSNDEYWVIDWIDSSRGCADGDVCRTYLIYLYHAPEIAELYLSQYCKETGKDRERILEWMPVVAAARLCENVPNEKEWLISKVNCSIKMNI